jgi:PAS domain S-box-containing protein
MTKKNIGSLSRPDDLRRLAEKIVRGKTPQISENLDTMSPQEQRQLLYELRVHEIELEMQNESLRQTKEELESAQMRYFNLYDLAPVGYFTLTREELILETNITAGSLLGVARNTLVKKAMTRFIFSGDQDIYYHHRKQLFETGAPQLCELRLVKKDGSLFWAQLVSTIAQEDESGDVLCYIIISDLTQRKQVEKNLIEAKEYLENLIKYANAPIIVWDTSLSITQFNRAFENLSGYNENEVIGKKIDILLSKNKIESALKHIQKISSGERWETAEIEIQRKDGESRIVLWSAANILDSEKKNIIATIAQGQDITERRQAELLILIQRDLALAISFSHQLDVALQRCLDTILQLSEMDCGRIYLIDQASGNLNLICHRNLSPAFIKSVSHYQADSTHTSLVLQGEPIFGRYSEFDLPIDKVEKAEKLKAFAVLPFVFENRVIGCLNLASKKLEDVSEINRQVLKTSAILMGEGITRLKVEEELRL